LAEIYLITGLSLIVGSLFLRRFTSMVQRHRDSRMMELGIAEYLNKTASEKAT
jgi:hypothetical protein